MGASMVEEGACERNRLLCKLWKAARSPEGDFRRNGKGEIGNLGRKILRQSGKVGSALETEEGIEVAVCEIEIDKRYAHAPGRCDKRGGRGNGGLPHSAPARAERNERCLLIQPIPCELRGAHLRSSPVRLGTVVLRVLPHGMGLDRAMLENAGDPRALCPSGKRSRYAVDNQNDLARAPVGRDGGAEVDIRNTRPAKTHDRSAGTVSFLDEERSELSCR